MKVSDLPAIWVDADACPTAIREVLLRVCKRTGIQVCFVANQAINLPPLPSLSMRQVEKGFDVADHFIVSRVSKGDLVVTQDIPLASEVIDLGAKAVGVRGQFYSAENIKSRLAMRDFMETMRASGVQSGGPPPFDKRDVQKFANELDRWIAKNFNP